MELSRLGEEVLPATLKGLASRAVGHPLSELGMLGLSLLDGDLPFPVAILKDEALSHNATWMRDFSRRAGVSLCPHGKTTMAPQLFERQLREGAWGISAATASHVRTYRRFGVPRILLANQLIGRANIDIVLDELDADPGFDFYCLVDSHDGLTQLQEGLARRPAARLPAQPLQVLLELGSPGGRTGVRSVEEGVSLGRALRDSGPAIALRGIETFEGIFGGELARVELAVHTMLDSVAELARRGVEEAWFAPGELILSAGGSAFFDMAGAVLAAARPGAPTRVVLRSGCYLSHDALHYERMQQRMRQRSPEIWGSGAGLQNALELWTVVQSVPEPGRAICAFGRRDASFDMELPRPLWWFRPGEGSHPLAVPATLRTSQLFDQHAYVDALPGSGPVPWRVGDFVGFGVAHPCTTFDKWPLLHRVDENYRVTGGVRTYF